MRIKQTLSSCLLFGTILLIPTFLLAFGGRGPMFKEKWMKGTDAIGIYFGGNGDPDIHFGECENGTMNIYGVCESCHDGYKLEDGKCYKDACRGVPNTECKICSSSKGVASYTSNTYCDNGQGKCVNYACKGICEGQTPDPSLCEKTLGVNNNHECVATEYLAPNTSCGEHKICDANHTCVCDTANGYVQDGTACVNKCADYQAPNTCTKCDPNTGNSISDSDKEGETCGTNKTCQNGECKCTSNYDEIAGTCYSKCGEHEVRDTDNNCVCDTKHNYYGNAGSCQLCDPDAHKEINKQGKCVCNGNYPIQGQNGTCTTAQGKECSDTNPCPGDYWCGNNKCTSIGHVYTKSIENLGMIAHSDSIAQNNNGQASSWCSSLNSSKHAIDGRSWKLLNYAVGDPFCQTSDCNGDLIKQQLNKNNEGENWTTIKWTDTQEHEGTVAYFWVDPNNNNALNVSTGAIEIPTGTDTQDIYYERAALCIACGNCDEGHYHPNDEECVCRSCSMTPPTNQTDCGECEKTWRDGACVQPCTKNEDCDDDKMCHNSSCVNPCDVAKEENKCVVSWKAEGHACVPDEYLGNNQSCDLEHTDYRCNDDAHVCMCPDNTLDQNGECVTCPTNSQCDGTAEFTCDKGYTKQNNQCLKTCESDNDCGNLKCDDTSKVCVNDCNNECLVVQQTDDTCTILGLQIDGTSCNNGNGTCANGDCKANTPGISCQQGYFNTTNDGCKSCYELDAYETDQNSCNTCTNRSYSNVSCFLTNCPEGSTSDAQNNCVASSDPCGTNENINCAGDKWCNTDTASCVGIDTVYTASIDNLGIVAYSQSIAKGNLAQNWCDALNHHPTYQKSDNVKWHLLSLQPHNSLQCNENNCNGSTIFQRLKAWHSVDTNYFWTVQEYSNNPQYKAIVLDGMAEGTIVESVDQGMTGSALCILCGESCPNTSGGVQQYHPSDGQGNPCLCRSCDEVVPTTKDDCDKCNAYEWNNGECRKKTTCSDGSDICGDPAYCDGQHCNTCTGVTDEQKNGCYKCTAGDQEHSFMPYMKQKQDGTSCGERKICSNGQCVDDDSCQNNASCPNGQYCDASSTTCKNCPENATCSHEDNTIGFTCNEGYTDGYDSCEKSDETTCSASHPELCTSFTACTDRSVGGNWCHYTMTESSFTSSTTTYYTACQKDACCPDEQCTIEIPQNCNANNLDACTTVLSCNAHGGYFQNGSCRTASDDNNTVICKIIETKNNTNTQHITTFVAHNTQGCINNCPNGYVWAQNACTKTVACLVDSDCENGSRCDEGVCHASCTSNSDCQGTEKCYNNSYCQDACADPNQVENTGCITGWTAENHTCTPTYAQQGASCGTNYTCNGDHQCVWNGTGDEPTENKQICSDQHPEYCTEHNCESFTSNTLCTCVEGQTTTHRCINENSYCTQACGDGYTYDPENDTYVKEEPQCTPNDCTTCNDNQPSYANKGTNCNNNLGLCNESGTCQDCSKQTLDGCNRGNCAALGCKYEWNNDQCTYNAAKTSCDIPYVEGSSCTSNGDCSIYPDTFCEASQRKCAYIGEILKPLNEDYTIQQYNNYDDSVSCSDNSVLCSSYKSNYCCAAGSTKTIQKDDLIQSGFEMSWQSAQNWCSAQNKSLLQIGTDISSSFLGCYSRQKSGNNYLQIDTAAQTCSQGATPPLPSKITNLSWTANTDLSSAYTIGNSAVGSQNQETSTAHALCQ